MVGVKKKVKVCFCVEHRFVRDLLESYVDKKLADEDFSISFADFEVESAEILFCDVNFLLYPKEKEILKTVIRENKGIILLNYSLSETEILILINMIPNIKGIIDSGMSAELLYKSLISVARGDIWIRRNILYSAVQKSSSLIRFSKRELEIIRFILQGKINKEIAKELNISEQTVKYYINSILGKVGGTGKLDIALKFCRFRSLLDFVVDNLNEKS